MATKKPKNEIKNYRVSMKEALEKFDLKALKSWMRIYNNSLYQQFKIKPEEVQTGIMCNMIINRTDMLNSEAHKKALKWQSEHNMRGMLF